jgi:hypothetical protein
MSTPIKPPDGTGGATGPEAPESASVADTEAFEATTKAATMGTDEVGGATSTAAAAGPEAIAADLQAGRIDLEEAVTRLVDRAVQSGMAAGLTDAGRAGLEAHLRRALADDPALGALQRDLDG